MHKKRWIKKEINKVVRVERKKRLRQFGKASVDDATEKEPNNQKITKPKTKNGLPESPMQ